MRKGEDKEGNKMGGKEKDRRFRRCRSWKEATRDRERVRGGKKKTRAGENRGDKKSRNEVRGREEVNRGKGDKK